ncbi:hypothetical protein AV521_45335, partial [Streptomyces sp. IMTB 2501]|uniref:SDR family NAD(P)-dependent oxidoreductase n=1 Tax=Streptomyces sp. IMTB 2501 TaxID=1776340 RepID=UPI00097B1128
LPTYAFDHTRYWLDRTRPETTNPAEHRFWEAVERHDAPGVATLVGIETAEARASLDMVVPSLAAWRRDQQGAWSFDSWRYRVDWRPLTDVQAPTMHGTWLIVVPTGTVGTDPVAVCVRALQEYGGDTRLLEVDAAGADRHTLAETLRTAAEGLDVRGVLSLLGVCETAHPRYPGVPAGAAATVVLAQAHADAQIDARLWSATTGAVAAVPGEPLTHPLQALIWGLGRVAGLENPGGWGGLIDLPDTFDAAIAPYLCAALAGIGDEDQLALRDTGVLVRRLVRAPLPDAPPATGWRPTGTALITGGTGALGGHVARWLARNGAPRIQLLSRKGPGAPGVEELRDELIELGAGSVTVTACDTADKDALAGVLADIPDEQPLTAVFHAAGVVGDAKQLLDMDLADVSERLAAKAAGAAHLHDLLRDASPEVFVLFSSVAGVWGSAGQAGYAAANAYLDALAEHRRAEGLRATAVAWGAWAGDGMARDGEYVAWLNKTGMRTMAPGQAIAALDAVVQHDEAFVAVSDMDWPRFAEVFNAARPRPLLKDLEPSDGDTTAPDESQGGRPSLAERLRQVPAAQRRSALLEVLGLEVASVLGHTGAMDLDQDLPFLKLGFDSLTGLELKSRLAAATGLDLAGTLLYDHPTAAELADHLLERLQGGEEGEPPVTALAEIRRLEQALASVPDDESLRDEITGRLETVLWNWQEAMRSRQQTEFAGSGADLDTATDDEIFDLLDREIGAN